jgi:hypothetical protein
MKNKFQKISNISIAGIVFLTIILVFFEKSIPKTIDYIIFVCLIILLIVFPVIEILKKVNKNEK